MKIEPARAFRLLPLRQGLFGRLSQSLRPRITHAVFVVGAIPIVIATVFAVASFVLLDRADEAHAGALRVATIYRQIVAAMSARDAYVAASPADRDRSFAAFTASLNSAGSGLRMLEARTKKGPDDENGATIASMLYNTYRYETAMRELIRTTVRNDGLLAEMDTRLSTLIALSDETRQRQHESNVDVVKTLTALDASLRSTQLVVDSAQTARTAITDAGQGADGGRGLPVREVPSEPAGFRNLRLANAADELGEALQKSGAAADAAAFRTLASGILAGQPARPGLDWLDRLLKIQITSQRAIQDQVAELLTYTVEAHETEQATQNIAIATLKLGERTLAAFSARDSRAVAAIIGESRRLGDSIAALPISPLIQTEMLDALDLWRDGLATIETGLAGQNTILGAMGDTASLMTIDVSTLNAEFSNNAEAISTAVRRILLVGAILGLLIGSATAILVARSISKPLRRLEYGMIDRAAHPDRDPLPDDDRRDEIGSMARATNYFLRELGKREGALRTAKERTEATLLQLRQTQSELIQAEKLASLGQLVAGVAHEINTPLGVALTTATVMAAEMRGFEADARDGRVTRDAFEDFLVRTGEGTRLIFANLERSANLVQSFKQVAVDQASGERRRFEVDAFVDELFTSLGPLIKRAGHGMDVRCEPGLVMDSYPGALAQILTNLVSNAFAHAFPKGSQGNVRVEIARAGAEAVRIVFSDDGRGILAENRPRIFDPFFTTGRSEGSTGLGLHIVFNLVTVTLGGAIALGAVEWPAFGKGPLPGARFTIDLPLTAPVPATERQGELPPPAFPASRPAS